MYLGNTPTQQAFVPAVDVFSGNGSTTAFTLSRPVASVAQVQAFIENVPQSPVDAFTVSGNTITFTSAPPSGSSNIYVRYTSPITQVMQPGDGSVGTNQLSAGAVSQSKVGTNVVGNGPAFSAYQSTGQTISNNVSTKLSFQLKEFDTNSNFDTTNYRFLPTVAGYYQINGTVYWAVAATNGQILQINKNGSVIKVGATYNSSSYGLVVSALVYMNGTTDYLELYVYQNSGSSATTTSGNVQTYFQGALVRAA